MADYYLLLDAVFFEERLRPALTASWLQRSFAPCRPVCDEVLPRAADFIARYQIGSEATVLREVTHGLTFQREFWRALVGELLFYAADEIPELQLASETLCCLLAPERYRLNERRREDFAPIEQVHRGSREVRFGAGYNPEQAGYNDTNDVQRLHAYLTSIEPAHFEVTDLAELREITDTDERRDELEWICEWFPSLVGLYERARSRNQVIVHETLGG